MSKLQEAFRKHCQTYLEVLSNLAESFNVGDEHSMECIEQLDSYWPQIEAARRWASELAVPSETAAFLTEQFAAFCAEDGDRLVEIHRPAAVRMEWLRSALMGAEHHGHQHAEARIRYNLGVLTGVFGDLKESRRQLEKSLAVFQELKAVSHECAAHNALGLLASEQDRHQAAIQSHQTAMQIAYDNHFERDAIVSVRFLAGALTKAGDIANACKVMRKSIIGFQNIEDHAAEADTMVSLGLLLLENRSLEESRDCTDAALAIIESQTLPIDGNLLHFRLACLMAQLNHDRTDSFLESTLQTAVRQKNRMLEGCLRQLRGSLLIDAGHTEAARSQLTESVRVFQSIGFDHGTRTSSRLMATLDKTTASQPSADN